MRIQFKFSPSELEKGNAARDLGVRDSQWHSLEVRDRLQLNNMRRTILKGAVVRVRSEQTQYAKGPQGIRTHMGNLHR